MHTILTLVRKDIKNFLRNRTAVILTFGIPIALIYIFGQVFGLNRTGQGSGPENIKLGVVVESNDPAAPKLVEALKAEKTFRVITRFDGPDGQSHPLTEADARRLIHDHEFNFALIIPADLLSPDKFGIHLKVLSNPRNDIETQTVNGLLQKTIFSNVPELLGASLQNRLKQLVGDDRVKRFNHEIAAASAGAFGGNPAKIEERMNSADFGFGALADRSKPPADPTLRRLDNVAPDSKPASVPTAAAPAKENTDIFSKIVQIDRDQVEGKKVKSPAATRVVGGWAIMFLLFSISRSSASFFDEKNTGIFQRILSAPVTRGQLLGSRLLFGILLGLVQLITMFTAGHFLFGIDVVGNLGNLVIASVLTAAACTAFGMLVAAISPNAEAANGISTFVVMVMSATGGAWFPISLMPEFMQKIGKCTIVYWSMESFSGVLWAGNTFRELLPTLSVLAAITVAVIAVALWRIKQKPLFN
jgi:ABC-2 type transport system permease protein